MPLTLQHMPHLSWACRQHSHDGKYLQLSPLSACCFSIKLLLVPTIDVVSHRHLLLNTILSFIKSLLEYSHLNQYSTLLSVKLSFRRSTNPVICHNVVLHHSVCSPGLHRLLRCHPRLPIPS